MLKYLGGVTAGLTLSEVLVKEANEEASIPSSISTNGSLTTFVQYCYHMDHFIKRELNFVFDLELPPDFTPSTNDGETVDFKCVKLDENCDIFDQPAEWKPNCFAITFDFAVRNGIYQPDAISDLLDWTYLMKNRNIFD